MTADGANPVAMRERHLRANGLRHHVVEWSADGPARGQVLLCHGFLDFGLGYCELAPRLARAGFRVVTFDWRGHGESEWVGAGGYYHFPDYVLDLAELVPQLFEGAFHLVGHSMGGTACSLYAASRPERLQTLALLEGLGPLSEPANVGPSRYRQWLDGVERIRKRSAPKLADLDEALSRMRRRNPSLPAQHAQLLAQRATRPHPDGDGLTWHFDPLHRTRAPVAFEAERFMHFTRSIQLPTLVVQGSRGLVTADDDARVGSLPDATKVVLQGADHMLQWSAAEPLSRALLDFWQGKSALPGT